MVGVDEAESEVTCCSDGGAVWGCCIGEKCAPVAAAAAAAASAPEVGGGGGLSGCGFVQTSFAVS